MPTKAASRPRKRRARRPVQDLSSSSSDSSSSSSSDEETTLPKTNEKGKAKALEQDDENAESSDGSASDSDSDDSSSSSSSGSSSGSSTGPIAKRGRLAKKAKAANAPDGTAAPATKVNVRRSPSPIPGSPPFPVSQPHISTSIPHFSHPPHFSLPSAAHPIGDSTSYATASDTMFKSWYMSNLVNRLSSELDSLRKDPEMAKPDGQTRFEVLVEALSSGADLFDDKGEWGARREVEVLGRERKGGKKGEKGLVLEAVELKEKMAPKEEDGKMEVDKEEGGSDSSSDDAMSE